MPTLNITRKNEFANLLRSFKIYLDGKLIGEMENGESQEFTVPVGHHALEVKLDWCSSPEILFNLDEHSVRKFEVRSTLSALRLISIFGTILFIHIIISYFFEFQYAIFLVVPAFLYQLYYITIGRNKYLTLKEI